MGDEDMDEELDFAASAQALDEAGESDDGSNEEDDMEDLPSGSDDEDLEQDHDDDDLGLDEGDDDQEPDFDGDADSDPDKWQTLGELDSDDDDEEITKPK